MISYSFKVIAIVEFKSAGVTSKSLFTLMTRVCSIVEATLEKTHGITTSIKAHETKHFNRYTVTCASEDVKVKTMAFNLLNKKLMKSSGVRDVLSRIEPTFEYEY